MYPDGFLRRGPPFTFPLRPECPVSHERFQPQLFAMLLMTHWESEQGNGRGHTRIRVVDMSVTTSFGIVTKTQMNGLSDFRSVSLGIGCILTGAW